MALVGFPIGARVTARWSQRSGRGPENTDRRTPILCFSYLQIYSATLSDSFLSIWNKNPQIDTLYCPHLPAVEQLGRAPAGRSVRRRTVSAELCLDVGTVGDPPTRDRPSGEQI